MSTATAPSGSYGKDEVRRQKERTPFWTRPENAAGWTRFLPYGLLLSLTVGLYARTTYYGFVWDDFHYIIENTRIQGLTPTNLLTIWTRPYFNQYAPLHLSFLAAVYSLAALHAAGYHLSQVLLQCCCVALLFLVLKKIESARIAFLSSLLFAVYPPNVETVAWISETKSTLAFMFFLLSFLFYMRHKEAGELRDGLLSGLFFALSLLSKLNTVGGPLVFVAYDRLYGKESKSKSRILTGSLFLLSALAAVIQLAVARGLTDPSHTLVDSTI